ncbi:MAG: Ig-like domain-containing protein, partial [Algicola sp.]|nr:Ig-like domain-containing protein [Algicola sp.]
RSVTRNIADASGRHPLAPGRPYCYNVKPVYGGDKKGYFTGSQCVTIGFQSILAAPEYLTIINHSFDPDDGYQEGYLLNWAKVENADYYQLDHSVYDAVTKTITWSPVYVGTNTEHRMFFLANNNEGFRVSACDNNERCGTYRRVYFNVQPNQIDVAQLKKPACLNVPDTAKIDGQIKLSWCPPQKAGLSHYQLLDINDTAVDLSLITTSVQGLPQLSVNAPTAGQQYCYKIKAFYSGESAGYIYENDNPDQGCGRVELQNNRPTITPKSPENGDVVFSVSHFIASAIALDSDGSIAKVEFKINDAQWQSDPFPLYVADFGILPVGSHTVEFRAMDNDGAYSDIQTRNFTVEQRNDAIAIELTKNEPSKGEFALAWNEVSGAQNYQLQMKIGTGSYSDVVHSEPLSHYRVGASKATYSFQVRACYAANDCTPYSSPYLVSVLDPEAARGIAYPVLDAIIPGEESFVTSVSQNGDAQITIPIGLPPGVNNLQPDMDLEYNSNRINKLRSQPYTLSTTSYYPGDYVGLGWRIKAFSSIHLCHTNETNNLVEVFSSHKYWCLDGQRLLRIGDSKEFTLQHNQNIKLKHFGSTALLAGYFEAYMPDGSVRTYGGEYGASNPSSSFISHELSDARSLSTSRYALSNITNVDGNQIHFGYVAATEEKQLYPKEITYGNNEDVRIILDYVYRVDASDIWGSGSVQYKYGSRNSALSAINVLQKDASATYQKIGRYVLYNDYPTDLSSGELAHRQLSQIQHCGYVGTDPKCFAPIQVSWKKTGETELNRYVDKITSSQGASVQFDIVKMDSSQPQAYFAERPFGEGDLPTGAYTRSAAKVVAMHKSNGVGGTNTLRYAYQGDLIARDEGPVGNKPDKRDNGFFALRVVNEQTGHVRYTQNFVDKPLLNAIAETRLYNGLYTGSGDSLISKQENHYGIEQRTYGDFEAKLPYLSATTRYAYEAGNLVVVNQIDNNHTFLDGFIDSTIQTIKAGTSFTAGAKGSLWGEKTKAILSGVIRTTVKETDLDHRSGSDYWLTNFTASQTVKNYPGDNNATTLDSQQTYEATPFGNTNKIHTRTLYKGDTNLELTSTYGYDASGLANSSTVTGAHIQSRSSSVNSFQDGRYPAQTSNALNHSTS